jgi:hypothetical protein
MAELETTDLVEYCGECCAVIVEKFCPVCGPSEFDASEDAQEDAESYSRASRADFVPGQVTVILSDGREFAVIKGRRWTRVPEYLSNGQLTARFFVDEATSEVRLADSWKAPKSWPIGQPHCLFALGIVAKAREQR